jgi:hypothetical protein
VDLSADRPERLLDRRVDVLRLGQGGGAGVAKLGELCLHLPELLVREDARAVQTPGVEGGALAVVRE